MVFFKYLFIFCVFSIVGWILEVMYRSYCTRKFVNPGFMSGCVVPLYGFGVIILNLICNMISSLNIDYKIIWIFLISTFILTLLEFISGFISLKLLNLRLWDYSTYRFNYNGFICLRFSLLWGLLSLIYYLFLYTTIDRISSTIIENTICIFSLGIFMGIFIIDLCVSIQLLSRLTKYAKNVREIIDLEKLKLDIRKKETEKKFFAAIYPYIPTNRFLKDKIKDLKKGSMSSSVGGTKN